MLQFNFYELWTTCKNRAVDNLSKKEAPPFIYDHLNIRHSFEAHGYSYYIFSGPHPASLCFRCMNHEPFYGHIDNI